MKITVYELKKKCKLFTGICLSSTFYNISILVYFQFLPISFSTCFWNGNRLFNSFCPSTIHLAPVLLVVGFLKEFQKPQLSFSTLCLWWLSNNNAMVNCTFWWQAFSFFQFTFQANNVAKKHFKATDFKCFKEIAFTRTGLKLNRGFKLFSDT